MAKISEAFAVSVDRRLLCPLFYFLLCIAIDVCGGKPSAWTERVSSPENAVVDDDGSANQIIDSPQRRAVYSLPLWRPQNLFAVDRINRYNDDDYLADAPPRNGASKNRCVLLFYSIVCQALSIVTCNHCNQWQ